MPIQSIRVRFLSIAAVCAAGTFIMFQPGSGRLQAQSGSACGPTVNPIVCENQNPGNLASEWDVSGSGDASIQGFATNISVTPGQTVSFKIDTSANAYSIDIYRMGYYGGLGARKVATVSPSAPLPQNQPACLTQASTTGLIDCGNWAVSASWAVPTTAVSGIYFARPKRTDTGGASHIFFIVRDDTRHADLLFQTSDTTWQAYNQYGGNSLYVGGPGTNPARAYKVSYNRPITTRGTGAEDFVFNAEYPMVRWLEANGYDVSYLSGVDADRGLNGQNLLLGHKVYLSVGHDEYWSGGQRANVEAARAAGVHLAFFSGDEMFWKTRWETSIDGSNTPYRTLVTYKETHANAVIDPADPPTWTGSWRDPRFSPPADGNRPENAVSGQWWKVNSGTSAITVPFAYSKFRLWRNTSVANLTSGQTAAFPMGTLGYEWDESPSNSATPSGLMRLSSTTVNVPQALLDYGSSFGAQNVTHNLTLYRHPTSGALVFGAGTIQWSWGLDSNHDRSGTATDVRMQQATVNLFADMAVQPGSLQSGLVTTAASSDAIAPTSTITAPAPGTSVVAGSPMTISGTAADTGGGVVALVEVSTDGGTTWRQATGTTSWTFNWTAAGSGTVSLKSRAYDDSANVELPGAGVNINVALSRTCPCSIFSGPATPAKQDDGDPGPIEVGMRFTSDISGYVTGVRFHKGTTLNGGTHVGHLWTNSGTLLGSVTFTSETASGWQQANFNPSIAINANTTYVISYYAPTGHYSSSGGFFATAGVDNAPLHALKDGVSGANGVYTSGASAFPQNTFQSEYDWVDVVFDTTAPPDTTPPTVTTTFPASNATGVDPAAAVTATFSEPMNANTISSSSSGGEGGVSFLGTFELTDPGGNLVAAVVGYDASTKTATLTPQAPLVLSTTYRALVKGGAVDPRVKDVAGNAMTANVTWTFTTAAAPPPPPSCPCNIWGTTVPNPVDDGDPASIEVGTKFRSDVAGYITGARFYKATQNTGTHTATLWTSTGTQLATATFTGESTSGWQQLSFASPVQIAAGTTYVVSYHAPNGHYSAPDNYFATAGVDNPPLHALKNGVDGPNGVYQYGTATAFPTQTFLSEGYFVDVVFTTTLGPDTTPPQVTSVSPAAGAGGVRTNASVTATFSEAMDAATITASTFKLVDASSAVIPATVSYTAATRVATLTPTATLANSAAYTATVTTGVRDIAGNALAAAMSWTFFTAAPPPPPPTQGPGGPILVVSTAANPFSTYYAEILRGEGANAFQVADLSQVTASTLAAYDVVILGQAPLTAAQVTMFSDWVTAGGNLIAMRPDKQLAGLLGLTDAAATLSDAYLQIDTASGPGAGIVAATLQFHGTADRYTLNGATSLATLFSTATASTANPAVTLRTVGSGHAAAFTFDLARSVVYTRQGNPAWSGQERDGVAVIRSDDLYFGAKTGDVQPDYVDFTKIAIPQADEQQRFLWNILLSMNSSKKPLPRFWYLPRMLKAAVVMTGDDHANGGTAGRFDSYVAFSPAGCNLANWECVRGTSYMFPNTPITDAVASSYVSQGFEIALHVNTNCADWTPSTLPGFYSSQLTQFATAYPHVPAPATNRTHCIAWSDYATQPQVELSNNIRFDTTYYFYPNTWVLDRPGLFTGSGMPQRFATAAGAMMDVYQAATSMTDESGQTYPKTVDALLNAATGPTGYYGVFTANMHTDFNNNQDGKDSKNGSDLIVVSAQARGVPVVSAKQMLDWLDGRNASSFQSIAWNGSVLTFTIAAGSGTNGLMTLVPATVGSVNVTGVSVNGAPVAYTTDTIKGVSYAIINAAAGSVQVSYGVDVTPPVISAITATSSTSSTATVTWTTNEPATTSLALGTSPTTLAQTFSDATLTTAHSVALSGLAPATKYYYLVTSADAAGNSATAPASPGTFTTAGLSIAGSIAPASVGAGAAVTVTGPVTGSTTADGAGQFTLNNLPAGTYTVTASKAGYSMTPPNQSVTLTTAGVTGVNFTAQPVVISGTISPVSAGSGTVVILGGAASGSVSADAQGVFTFSAVANGNYTVTPSRTGYTFTPANAAVTVSGASVTGVNFTGQPIPTYKITGTLTPASLGSGATVTLSGGATLTTTADVNGVYTFSGLSNGQYTVTPSKSGVTFTPLNAAVTITSADATANFTATQAVAPTIDATVFVDRSTKSTTLVSPALSTTAANELLLAFVSSDDVNGTAMSVTGITGGGTWALVRRTNTQRGTAEIWRAFAPATLSNATVTATLSGSVAASMTVMSFKGVDTTGINGSGAIGATAGGTALSGAPTATLTTTRANSLVIGVGNDWDTATARTVGGGQVIVHQYLATVGDTFWVQRTANPVAASGTVVTINDTAPTADRYNLAVCEILAGG